ncbi:hypothetical protein HPP92_007981 [Vanilla planifolia]|uniref:Uncharacterized protein n=1 Tax=Vanilla planifolia TaxID=51239 RepID=A0A835RRZ1_VANPL|nr:hypothetical protein HPP92_007981 [Vanilla planifolia]
MPSIVDDFVHEEEEVDHPMRYLPICHVYSSTTPCVSAVGSTNFASKKVKKFSVDVEEDGKDKKLIDLFSRGSGLGNAGKPILVYRRRAKKPRAMLDRGNLGSCVAAVVEPENCGEVNLTDDNDEGSDRREEVVGNDGDLSGDKWNSVVGGSRKGKNGKTRQNFELMSLGALPDVPDGDAAGETRRRGSRRLVRVNPPVERSQIRDSSDHRTGRKWVELDFEGADPRAFIGLACKVFWPLDDDWYTGCVVAYDSATRRHHIKYNDGDAEHVLLMNEKIRFHISFREIQLLNLKLGVSKSKNGMDHYEMLSLAVVSEDHDVLESGDVVWAKLTGHSMWPALIVNEPYAGANGLKPVRREQSVFVQFFGTHDFARISLKQIMPFGKGVHYSLHLKCKQAIFLQSLEEVKLYLSNQYFPERMLRLQKSMGINHNNTASDENMGGGFPFEDTPENELLRHTDDFIGKPIEVGNLRVTCLGNVVPDSVYFRNKNHVWPEGYTAYRKFASTKDTCLIGVYKMEVLRNPKSISRPLFRVTTDDGEQINGSNPNDCWKQVYERIRRTQSKDSLAEVEGYDLDKSGSDMFGFSDPMISKLIQCRPGLEKEQKLPTGYRAVRIEWKDLDKCNVCHMDEEYEGNLFLQCDKCRMMVHARCYGELGPLDGELWHCKLCRAGAPRTSPPCCLCPVTGGAMKPTTDGQWAHLACAIWIPETCLSDVKKMEPIDGIGRIHKDRWKLLCSICHVSYGACIQCSNSTCRVAYHPLCARAAGYCVELEDENKIHLMSLDDDDDDQCIRLISFCKKHSHSSNDRTPSEEVSTLPAKQDSCYVPPPNLSGCARTEPYSFAQRKKQKETHILAAADAKQLYVENRPYLVTGYCQNGIASGKSRIHGFGVFAKLPHKAGDMVVEYAGELVRPSIADIREHCIYNTLVGAGTYMFRIDNERVIDATKAGSIAHLINHSCEPNCYSRVISFNGDEHIIIFAKRDIKQWEELTYDYRFFSKDELACYCGFPRCRGIVNDIDDQALQIEVPRMDLINWDDE